MEQEWDKVSMRRKDGARMGQSKHETKDRARMGRKKTKCVVCSSLKLPCYDIELRDALRLAVALSPPANVRPPLTSICCCRSAGGGGGGQRGCHWGPQGWGQLPPMGQQRRE